MPSIEREGIALHQHAVRERARVAFVGIAGDELRRRLLVEHRLPLDAGGERRTASPAQSRTR